MTGRHDSRTSPLGSRSASHNPAPSAPSASKLAGSPVSSVRSTFRYASTRDSRGAVRMSISRIPRSSPNAPTLSKFSCTTVKPLVGSTTTIDLAMTRTPLRPLALRPEPTRRLGNDGQDMAQVVWHAIRRNTGDLGGYLGVLNTLSTVEVADAHR